MSKTKIEWCDYTINPVKGLCPVDCKDNQGKPYCYARRLYKRFKWNPEIRYDDWVWQVGGYIPKDSKTFVGSTMELFGDWVKPEWLRLIFDYCESASAHTFIFLTKQPQNLIKWSPFPDNCWVGVSVTNQLMIESALLGLADIVASKRFLSIEPILEQTKLTDEDCELLDWLIIGQRTPASVKTRPSTQSITQIMTAADRAGIPIFLKNNLKELLPFQQYFKTNDNWKEVYKLRQEFPK